VNDSRHVPVLLKEVLGLLDPGRFHGGPSLWMDGTLGMGGHARAVLEAAGPQACLVGTDRDPQALGFAGENLAGFGGRFKPLHKSFADVTAEDAVWPLGVDPRGRQGFDGILLDLGVSSFQLDTAERGFSFQNDGPLDMRMDPGAGVGAGEWLRDADQGSLEEALREYGEERQARRLARAVLEARDRGELRGTLALAKVAEKTLGRPPQGRIHPATRLFQALRLAVNGELEAVDQALPRLAGLLAPGGRLAVISFHSLEDRRVKEYFRREGRDCVCPPGLPECRCGHRAFWKVLTTKPQVAGDEEMIANPRSRSAKLRAAERL
jgi:16S rRNA (cytosine1402-N4)-methyltransferase